MQGDALGQQVPLRHDRRMSVLSSAGQTRSLRLGFGYMYVRAFQAAWR